MEQYQRQCVIHLVAGGERAERLGLVLAEVLGVQYRSGWLDAAWASVGVDRKDEWSRAHGPRPGETHELEVLAADAITVGEFKDRLRELLRRLHEAELQPVLACDFEDELAGWDEGL